MRLIAIAVVVITASGCMTLYGGAMQRIRVTSTPPDAQAFLAQRAPGGLREPERRRREHDRWLREPAGLREDLHRSLARRAPPEQMRQRKKRGYPWR